MNRRLGILCLLFFGFWGGNLSAQYRVIVDSLLAEVQSGIQDTSLVNTYALLAKNYVYLGQQYDSALYYAEVTVEEAEMFRAISESLDCPVPPVMASGP